MKSIQTFFFADYDDIKSIIESIESDNYVKYCQVGLFDINPTPELNSFFELTTIGYVKYGDWNLNSAFLIVDKNSDINIRSVEQIKGGIKYAVDQKNNPNSIVFKPSGIYKEGVFVAGSIGTISETDFSKKLFKTYSSLIKKNFMKVGSFYVGKNALNKLNNGWRFVTNEKSPSEYDLKQ
jgi:hypothetical protein